MQKMQGGSESRRRDQFRLLSWQTGTGKSGEKSKEEEDGSRGFGTQLEETRRNLVRWRCSRNGFEASSSQEMEVERSAQAGG